MRDSVKNVRLALSAPALIALVKTAPIGLAATFGYEHVLVAGNDNYFKLVYWLDQDGALGHKYADIYRDKDTGGYVIEALDTVYQSGQTLELKDLEYDLPAGEVILNSYWTITIAPYFNPDIPTEVSGLLLYFTDTTEQVMARKRLQEAAQADFERARELNVILENIKEGVMVSKPQRGILWMNTEAFRLLGVTDEDDIKNPRNLVRKPLTGYTLDGKDYPLENWPETIARLKKTIVSDDFCVKRYDGKIIPLSSTAVPVMGTDDKVELIVTVFRDISERLEAELQQHNLLQLEAEKAKELQVILDNISDGVLVIGPDLKLISINPTACRFLDVLPDDFNTNPLLLNEISSRFYTLEGEKIPGERLPGPVALNEKHFAEGEIMVRRKDGSEIKLHAASTPVLSDDGALKMVVSVYQDITARIEADRRQRELLERLEAERSKLDAIINDIGPGLVVVGNDRKIILVNRQFNTLPQVHTYYTGKDLQELVSHYSALVTEPLEFQTFIQMVLDNPRIHHTAEFSIAEPINLEARILTFPILDVNDLVLGWGALVEDVTRENQIMRLRNQFVATASHELRTPMTGIVGFAELLLNREVSPELSRKWLKNIYDESLRVSRIINSMLDISKIEAGILRLKRTSFNLAVTLENIVSRTGEFFNNRLITLTLVGLTSSESRFVGDEERLTEAIKRILGNALKFSPVEKPVELHLYRINGQLPEWLEDYPENFPAAVKTTALLLVSIRDYGVGILPTDMPHIFEPFYRSLNSANSSERGSGLGLALARRLIDLHGGFLWATSTPGQGSVFYCALPQHF
jgi:PAS domain S-box-containing protein